MGYMTLICECCNCHKMFSANPNLVPTANGQPICKSCVEWANPIRKARGLPLIPMAAEAYEPCDE